MGRDGGRQREGGGEGGGIWIKREGEERRCVRDGKGAWL